MTSHFRLDNIKKEHDLVSTSFVNVVLAKVVKDWNLLQNYAPLPVYVILWNYKRTFILKHVSQLFDRQQSESFSSLKVENWIQKTIQKRSGNRKLSAFDQSNHPTQLHPNMFKLINKNRFLTMHILTLRGFIYLNLSNLFFTIQVALMLINIASITNWLYRTFKLSNPNV